MYFRRRVTSTRHCAGITSRRYEVLADLRHDAATARAKRARRLDDPFHPRQMGRQAAAIAMRTLIRRAPRSALDHSLGSLLSRVQDALRGLHLFQRQVILIWPKLLGLRAELLASQFAENDLQPTPRLFRRRQRPLMLAQGSLRLRQKHLQRSFSSRSAAMLMRYFEHIATAPATFKIAPESICRSYPAAWGRRASSGRTNLQCSPSNRAANIAGDMHITPSAIVGQTNLQPSRGL